MNQADLDDPAKLAKDEATIPLRRGGSPEEIAELALLLASSSADYVTGSTYGLMSNAMWRGVPLRDLLAAAAPAREAKRIALHAADNYIETIPFAKALQPTTLVAWEMDGQALLPRHGFPARIIVPGLFGEKNIKWLTGITVETTEFKGFYERQGWGPHYEIPKHARFDAPDFSKPLRRGPIALRGVAFCGDCGVRRVEVSTPMTARRGAMRHLRRPTANSRGASGVTTGGRRAPDRIDLRYVRPTREARCRLRPCGAPKRRARRATIAWKRTSSEGFGVLT